MREIIRDIAYRIVGINSVERKLLKYINSDPKTKEEPKLIDMPAPSINLTTLGRQVPRTAPDWTKGLSQNLDQGVVRAALNQHGIGTKMGGSVVGDPTPPQEQKVQSIIFPRISSERLRRAEEENQRKHKSS